MASPIVDVSVELDGFDDLARGFDLTQKQIKSSVASAVKKTATVARNQVASDIAKNNGIKVADFKRIRIKRKKLSRKDLAIIWSGLDDVKAQFVRGKIEQLESGVFVGKLFFEGAFIMRTSSGKQLVMKRKIPSKRKSSKATSKNLPVVEQRVKLLKVNQSLAKAEKKAAKKLEELLVQELDKKLRR